MLIFGGFVNRVTSVKRPLLREGLQRYHWEKMPIIEVPFRRIAVDLVGPIQPAISKDDRYILTVVDFATRYPEAVALKGIETERVAEALVNVFCTVGVPKEMLTDMGSQFTSELMAEVSHLLSIRQLTTSPYHPMCNGLVERTSMLQI